MKYFTLFLISLFSFSVFGQAQVAQINAQLKKPCSAGFLNAQIRGFALGASKDSINQTFPDLVWDTNKNGVEQSRSVVFKDKERFYDLVSIDFRIYENALYSVIATYKDADYTSTKTYADAITKSWKIKEKWFNVSSFLTSGCSQRVAILTSFRDTKILSLSDSLISDKISKNEDSKRKPIVP